MSPHWHLKALKNHGMIFAARRVSGNASSYPDK
jgi:hypothetical protein